jgi:hypothetical protein
MLLALATCDGLRFRHIVMAVPLTTRLSDLPSAHSFLQTGNTGADDERHNGDDRQQRGPVSRWEEVSHTARLPRVRGE